MFRKLFPLLALVACTPLETNCKPGVSLTQLNRDQTQCDVRALRDVPQSVRIRRLPAEFVPARKQCNKKGRCRVFPGYWIPGDIQSYDPNDGLRKRVGQQCMADRGYAPVSIPQCSTEIAKAAPVRATTRLPRLTEQSCVIRNRDGSIQIVNFG